MKIRITHLDGKLPNLALMKLAHWHKAEGNEVTFSRLPTPTMFEPQYDQVYASTIFDWTHPVVKRLRLAYPEAIVGGTGSGNWGIVEDQIGERPYESYDYSIYPDYPVSIGYTQRGCRLGCKFCVVPKKEGKPVAVNTIADIWRPGFPRKVMLLDNDFFGVPSWPDRIEEIKDGDYRVCFSQGINIRMVGEKEAAALASIEYRDNGFQRRRLYTAWDNLKDEQTFFKGLDLLNAAGIPSKQVMVYMLVGWAKDETMEAIFHRFNRLRATGCLPYPMVFNKQNNPKLRSFARWVIKRYYHMVPWSEFNG